MHSPLSMQEEAHLREASGPSPERTRSITPEMTATGDASAMSAGPTLGQASTHLPHFTQASSMSPTRPFKAASKLRSVMGTFSDDRGSAPSMQGRFLNPESPDITFRATGHPPNCSSGQFELLEGASWLPTNKTMWALTLPLPRSR